MQKVSSVGIFISDG